MLSIIEYIGSKHRVYCVVSWKKKLWIKAKREHINEWEKRWDCVRRHANAFTTKALTKSLFTLF
jgi:hypothetical protein